MRGMAMATVICALAALGGCELAALLGEGAEPALHKIDEGTKILVVVDVGDGVALPPAFSTTLADQIGAHLVKENAVDVPVVPQDDLVKLQLTNPEAYKRMGLADIAQATGADQVLLVYITRFDTPREESGLVARGNAVAHVKLVDKAGQRVWPGDAMGQEVTAQANETLLNEKSLEQVQKDMGAKLALRTGRMFHAYEVDSHKMDR
jgi:hypothetical protein